MADDPFVNRSSQQPPLLRPIPVRNFSINTDSSDSPVHAYAPATPPSAHDLQSRPSDFLAQLNARLLGTYNARNGAPPEDAAGDGQGPPGRNKSLLDMTKSTLFGIYDDEDGVVGERSVAETPWGTGAETPARKSLDSGRWENSMGSPDAGLSIRHRARVGRQNSNGPRSPIGGQVVKAPRRGLMKYAMIIGKLASLFLLGVTYGVIVSHLHDSRSLAAVRVEGVDRESWTYLMSWGFAGIALGTSLPYAELEWWPQSVDGSAQEEELEKDNETSLGEQLNDIVRSVGAFVGIAFAIRRLPWQSTLQLTFTLALVNPALWYILDRSKAGVYFSLAVTSVLTSFIFLSNPDVLPSPILPVTANSTHTPSAASPQQDLFAGVIYYETLAVVTWVGSVLFCSCVCFGSIGRRLAVWDAGQKR